MNRRQDLTSQIVEMRAIEVLEAFVEHGRAEDARVEFKREIPQDTLKMARMLAAMANAARTEPFLVLVGVDESTCEIVSGRLPEDGANYWPQVWKHFEDLHAPVPVDVSVEFNGAHPLALGFTCELPPYRIRAAERLETLWREGTRIRAATRGELLRMLLPPTRAPRVEVSKQVWDESGCGIRFFVVPPTTDVVVLIPRRCVLQLGDRRITAKAVRIDESTLRGREHPTLKQAGDQGIYFYGPGEAYMQWSFPMGWLEGGRTARLTFEPGDREITVPIPPR
jgi:hypothetical protein